MFTICMSLFVCNSKFVASFVTNINIKFVANGFCFSLMMRDFNF